MCVLCHDTGIIRKEAYPGVIETNGCNCEIAKQQEVAQKENWDAWIQKFEGWKRGLLHEQRVS
ncbi:hypothetical protein J0801_12500 [Bacillus cereus]|uniref:hypothetical protein n=1 Tax=Bacillus cereus group TaxID=86661 RepID=UPI000BEDE719|nr:MULTISPECIES: hypothetical protein [Bacillus cereus group]EKS7866069.1 hypothetical protein [Bacillus cereus]PEF01404.1 hypothetical protein CON21_04660 [Bacillus thuringiensis]PFR58964.1 hypothetical protein COK36_19850 [Bacillus cereus]PGR92330.1 hypothetical protein COC68_25990 [Bacillus thuringiensis]PGU22146.1 hypothetical protein COD65_27685 [Bacillus cereus]